MLDRSKIVLVPILVVVAGWYIALGSAQAQTAGDAVRGSTLAESWCASCHIIDPKGTGRAVDLAPAFPPIASDPKKTPG